MPVPPAGTTLGASCGKPPDAYATVLVYGKVPSQVTLCDNCLTVSLLKRLLSDTRLFLSDEGVSTHAQDRYVEIQPQ
jgi:hypothetical protein